MLELRTYKFYQLLFVVKITIPLTEMWKLKDKIWWIFFERSAVIHSYSRIGSHSFHNLINANLYKKQGLVQKK